ncbi:uncharacterized protein F5891DRAFT_973507 [Suillus fuscotomentosus]|uniref:Uncharacterized protein n=1 Tax=Suillus fuscotomentosus TaxID=1912939 RepID=A0AAD4DMK5_9AGAM|nr:uncharacterized protein F5891DRAFT_973572 [Suillus fuscotomentosus]XP_041216089.1 uncharacterized protein F5891DRAFT_973507 [Suillus fuscotomentosus]KAG1879964.1 hypothetical protein F5891DRAFT_973572 [Suillus fuscotomentosus]KAG1881023.1 hypothetical protein F5891DRAFT_973507 [Suillus fuscotomentosus]
MNLFVQHTHGFTDRLRKVNVRVSFLLDNLRHSLVFIAGLQAASLEDHASGLDSETIGRLRNPPQYTATIDDPHVRAALENYMHLKHSDSDFDHTRLSYIKGNNIDPAEFLTLYQTKKIAEDITGVYSAMHDMRPNSCIGYTVPFSHLEHCPECGWFRYDQALLEKTSGRTKNLACSFPLPPPSTLVP